MTDTSANFTKDVRVKTFFTYGMVVAFPAMYFFAPIPFEALIVLFMSVMVYLMNVNFKILMELIISGVSYLKSNQEMHSIGNLLKEGGDGITKKVIKVRSKKELDRVLADLDNIMDEDGALDDLEKKD